MDVWPRVLKDDDNDDNDSSSTFLSLSGLRSGYEQTTNIMNGPRAPPCLSDMIGMIGARRRKNFGCIRDIMVYMHRESTQRQWQMSSLNSVDYRQLQERMRIVERAHAFDNAGLNQRPLRRNC